VSSNREIRADHDKLVALFEQARAAGDLDATACRTDPVRLVQVGAVASEAAEVEVSAALERGEVAVADRELREIAVVLAKTRELVTFSTRCTAVDKTSPGETDLDYRSTLPPAGPLGPTPEPLGQKSPRRGPGVR
jgi:hypothetical protein